MQVDAQRLHAVNHHVEAEIVLQVVNQVGTVDVVLDYVADFLVGDHFAGGVLTQGRVVLVV